MIIWTVPINKKDFCSKNVLLKGLTVAPLHLKMMHCNKISIAEINDNIDESPPISS